MGEISQVVMGSYVIGRNDRSRAMGWVEIAFALRHQVDGGGRNCFVEEDSHAIEAHGFLYFMARSIARGGEVWGIIVVSI